MDSDWLQHVGKNAIFDSESQFWEKRILGKSQNSIFPNLLGIDRE